MIEQPISPTSISDFVTEANAILKTDHGAWQKFVNEHHFTVDSPPPADSQSDEYLSYQNDIWKVVSGRDLYTPDECEQNLHIPEIANVQQSYPFSSRNSQEVGNYFFGAANIFRHLNVAPPAKIVEFGVGYGHVTRMMSNMGYDVTAIDIEKGFLDFLPKLALPGASPISVLNQSFVDATFEPSSVDCFVFYECFHHCLEHRKLIGNLAPALKDGGKILFAAEAFYEDWFQFPWGVRLDGHSVWAIHNFGWMELGFRKSYMTDLLGEHGFDLTWSSIPEVGAYGEMLVAALSS